MVVKDDASLRKYVVSQIERLGCASPILRE